MDAFVELATKNDQFPPSSPIVTQNDALPPWCSSHINTRYQASNKLVFNSQLAIYHFLGRALETGHDFFPPIKFMCSRDTNNLTFDLQDVCNEVVHPITRETITKHNKLVNDAIFMPGKKECAVMAYCSRIRHYWGHNTVQFLDHEHIKNIP